MHVCLWQVYSAPMMRGENSFPLPSVSSPETPLPSNKGEKNSEMISQLKHATFPDHVSPASHLLFFVFLLEF